MSTGPVPGNGIAITIPQGSVVFWSAMAQASLNQFVEICTADKEPIFLRRARPDGVT